MSPDALAALVPGLGLFPAEDIVGWFIEHGTYPDEGTLCSAIGLSPALAAEVCGVLATLATRPSATHPVGSVRPPESDDVDAADEDVIDLPDSGHVGAPANDVEAERPVALVAPRPVSVAPCPVSVAPPAVAAPLAAASTPPHVASTPPHAASTPPHVASTPPHAASVAAPAPAAKTTWPRALLFVLGGIVVLNATVIGGIVQTRREARRAVAPVAGLGAEVKGLEVEQTHARVALDETRAALEETQRTVAKQESALRATAEAVSENAARQKVTEAEVRELGGREARDVATLASRMRLVERRGTDGTIPVSLGEAIQLIDAAHGTPHHAKPLAVPEVHAGHPAADPVSHPAPAHAHSPAPPHASAGEHASDSEHAAPATAHTPAPAHVAVPEHDAPHIDW